MKDCAKCKKAGRKKCSCKKITKGKDLGSAIGSASIQAVIDAANRKPPRPPKYTTAIPKEFRKRKKTKGSVGSGSYGGGKRMNRGSMPF